MLRYHLLNLIIFSFSSVHRICYRVCVCVCSGTTNSKVHWRDAVASTRDWAQGLRDKMVQLTNVSPESHLQFLIFIHSVVVLIVVRVWSAWVADLWISESQSNASNLGRTSITIIVTYFTLYTVSKTSLSTSIFPSVVLVMLFFRNIHRRITERHFHWLPIDTTYRNLFYQTIL